MNSTCTFLHNLPLPNNLIPLIQCPILLKVVVVVITMMRTMMKMMIEAAIGKLLTEKFSYLNQNSNLQTTYYDYI